MNGEPATGSNTLVTHALEHPSALASSALLLTSPMSSMAWESAAGRRLPTQLTFLTFGAAVTLRVVLPASERQPSGLCLREWEDRPVSSAYHTGRGATLL